MSSGDVSSKLFEKLKVFKNFSNDSIFFKYIFDEKDIVEHNEDSKKCQENEENQVGVFKPEFTHQIFGDEEIIFGYKNLKIDYYLTPGLLEAYIGLNYKEKINPKQFEGIEPDDVFSSFVEFDCSPGFTRNLNVFRSEKLVKDLEFRPYGTKIYEYKRPSTSSTFEIYRMDSSFPEYESQKFVDYILRVQTMLVYFIETSSFVDTDDPQWTYYLLYEKKKIDQTYRFVTIGYLSVYNYYAYPDKTRSRISQIMIFPGYQNAGHGAELIESVYRDACNNPSIIDVTAESPSPEFMTVRDFVTTKMCLTLDSFKDKSKLKNGYTAEIMTEALKKLKLPKLQSRRCYEILRMSVTNENDAEEWRNFRLDLKKRFYLPFIRKSRYARNAGAHPEQPAEEATQSSKFPDTKSLDARFTNGPKNGGSSSKFSKEKSTTIGFGNTNGTAKTNGNKFSFEESTTIGFGNTNGVSKINGVKSVSFKSNSLNTSNSTTDNSSYSEDDNPDKPVSSTLSSANLFVSEAERKKLLEDEFQESVESYTKVLKRLEKANIISH